MKNFQDKRASIALAKNSTVINDDIFKKQLENCFQVLTERKEIHTTNNLYNSKPDIIKEFYASLLTVTTEFVRQNVNREDITFFLHDECGLSSERTNLYISMLEEKKCQLQIALLNIGSALPHVTDIKWKIDYIVKSSEVESAEGPLFRICLIGEQYDIEKDSKVLKPIHFTCNSVELLDLIYKFKDALRHCNSVTQRVF
ncbi:unnamed protein product [Diabrotica balteata]|uniref:COMM domain-containing protein 3 n=1 Tax=Diabrotica balteata TaxID=107213 RepID=A0A9N9T2D6_DIABA|nr:unnamed protein product [Diabrotica balteata]